MERAKLKVKELIEKLQKIDGEKDVALYLSDHFDDGHAEGYALSVEEYQGHIVINDTQEEG